MEVYFLFGALAISTLAAITDIRSGRIANKLTYGGLLGALAVRPLVLGWPGVKDGLLGGLAGGAIFLLLFLIGGMGGGDVKLMAAVGAWVGYQQLFDLLIAVGVAGGILAVGFMVFRGRVGRTLLNTVELIQHHLVSGFQPHSALNIQEPNSMRLPYGLAIAIGVLYRVGRTY